MAEWWVFKKKKKNGTSHTSLTQCCANNWQASGSEQLTAGADGGEFFVYAPVGGARAPPFVGFCIVRALAVANSVRSRDLLRRRPPCQARAYLAGSGKTAKGSLGLGGACSSRKECPPSLLRQSLNLDSRL